MHMGEHVERRGRGRRIAYTYVETSDVAEDCAVIGVVGVTYSGATSSAGTGRGITTEGRRGGNGDRGGVRSHRLLLPGQALRAAPQAAEDSLQVGRQRCL